MRVLLVEDEVRLAEAVRQGLAQERIRVQVCHDGTEGLQRALHERYDVVVLDLMLPGTNGYTVLRELRRAGVWTPVLMLTAKDGEHEEADAFDLGADDYLTKPFSYVVLIARLRALVRRGAPARPVVLRVGDVELDPARHATTLRGEELNLTPREFSLLELFLRHPDEALSKTAILERVWDQHYAGDPNVVEVYVGYLRKKLPGVPLETVRGIGYRLSSGT